MAVQTNVATIEPHPGRYVELPSLAAAIRRAGFTPGRMTIQATGHFEEVNGKFRFRIRGWPSAFAVHDGSHWSAGSTHRIAATVDYGSEPLALHVRALDQGAASREID